MDKPPPAIFSRQQAEAKWERARQRQARAAGTAFLADVVAEDILERLAFIRVQPQRALFVGDLGAHLASAFRGWDAAVDVGMLGRFDEESPAARPGYDLVVHLLGLGHVNDLPGALIHARHALAQDGLFIAAVPGAGSLPALRRITLAADDERAAPRIHPLIGNQAAAALLQRAGFRRQVVDSYAINLRYGALSTLVSDLRDHGLTRALSTPSPPWTRAGLARAEAEFEAMRDNDGKVPEVIEILVMSGWR